MHMDQPKSDLSDLLQQARAHLARRRFEDALVALKQALTIEPRRMDAWMLRAMVGRALADPSEELAALQAALSLNPYDLFALLVKGDALERLGRRDEALAAYRAACQVASELDAEALGTDVQRMLGRAETVVRGADSRLANALDSLVAEHGVGLQGAERDRFVHAVDLLLGRRKRFDAQPMGLFYPQLPAIEFFPRARFPWLADLEANTAAIRDEFLKVLAQDSGFEPYMQYGSDQPLAQWAELNQNPAWSAFHLLKDGLRVEENAKRCPLTMSALADLPQPQQVARTPVALFSCLKPQTRIPPHVGVSNVRLLTHLPLIIPPNCGFRVGSQTWQWEPGTALVFDDTIEHEAWNLSNELRVVLIFDIWHPDLTEAERTMVSSLIQVQHSLTNELRKVDLP